MRRMRNRMIHGYDTIDAARVLDAVAINIEPLVAVLGKAIHSGDGQLSE